MDPSYYATEMESWLPFSLDTFGSDSDGSHGSAGKGEISFASLGHVDMLGGEKDGTQKYSPSMEGPAEKFEENNNALSALSERPPMVMSNLQPWGKTSMNSKLDISEPAPHTQESEDERKANEPAQNIVAVNDISTQHWDPVNRSMQVGKGASSRCALSQGSERTDAHENVSTKISSPPYPIHQSFDPTQRSSQRISDSDRVPSHGGCDHNTDCKQTSDRNQQILANPASAQKEPASWEMPLQYVENSSGNMLSYPTIKTEPHIKEEGTQPSGAHSQEIQNQPDPSSWTVKSEKMTEPYMMPVGSSGASLRDNLSVSPGPYNNAGTDNDNSDTGEDFDDLKDHQGFEMGSSGKSGGSKIPNQRRLERNAREQKRSKKIANQIEMLRQLLRNAGKPVKGNKASILSETADFIQELREVRKYLQETTCKSVTSDTSSVLSSQLVSDHSYRLAFQESGVPMAIATMDGCLIDSNDEFLGASSYTREELLKLTIFNLTAASDLQETFGRVSQMLRSTEESPLFRIRAVMKHNEERGYLMVSLVRDDQRRPIYFFICSLPTEDKSSLPTDPSIRLTGWMSNHQAAVVGNATQQLAMAQQTMPPHAMLSPQQRNPQGMQRMPHGIPGMPSGMPPVMGQAMTGMAPGLAQGMAPGMAPGMMGFGCIW
eukprot:CAMPEP_0185793686 /NCGR_PEP_ID=MMETSP1174-20130828/159606_1 /TAXON_ID=35687 /ORGANISM="Dictyocha speculum, Strain CCMP1381" /LENGTH=659 /DNA_ID=CAMNT_0028488857 /DNA_START=165 /DNA_END=2141 /DNA_ORIENTATION=-